VHLGGFISALRFSEGKLYSGGKDGFVKIIDPASQSEIGSIDFGGILIRAIDVMGGNALVGCRNGTIYQVNIATSEKSEIMQSHSDGEVWGLSVVNQDTLLTSGDDNQLKAWSVSQRRCVSNGIISSEARKVKRRGASSLTQFADSQCSRAIAYNPGNGQVAIGHNDGTLTIR
jgi:WD40 repeat protein